MDFNGEEKMNSNNPSTKRKFHTELGNWWNENVMEHFAKANLFIVCCVAAGFLLVAYLAAFSCEVSWLLEAHGDLPTSAYLLCAGYFIMFVSATILIHGLVTGLSWGLFSWSIVIGILSIPELAFVMIMTTQHWGLQSTHGLTELISYLIRLIINCLALLCVIPTAIKWRRESQVLTQLQTLAARLQLQTPPPSTPLSKVGSRRSSSRRHYPHRRASAYDNPGFQAHEAGIPGMIPPSCYGGFGSQNEFNASLFGLNDGQFITGCSREPRINAKRTQSLVDLRYILPDMFMFNTKMDNNDINNGKFINNNIEKSKNINEKQKNMEDLSTIESISDPIYCTIEPKGAKLSRNCVSLENLGGITKLKNDLSYGNNLLQNYHLWPWYAHNPINYPHYYHHHQQHHQHPHQQQQQQQQHHYHHHPQYQHHMGNFPFHFYNPLPLIGCGGVGYGGYTNPYVNASSTNSRQSLGNESDDYRKYRDVAL